MTLCKILDERRAVLKWMIYCVMVLLQSSFSATNMTIYRACIFIKFLHLQRTSFALAKQ